MPFRNDYGSTYRGAAIRMLQTQPSNFNPACRRPLRLLQLVLRSAAIALPTSKPPAFNIG